MWVPRSAKVGQIPVASRATCVGVPCGAGRPLSLRVTRIVTMLDADVPAVSVEGLAITLMLKVVDVVGPQTDRALALHTMPYIS